MLAWQNGVVPVEIPPLLAARAKDWGAASGGRWLRKLPGLIDALAESWNLQLGAVLPSHVSFVALATRVPSGESAVLKIPMAGVEFPYAQANNRTFEPLALEHWRGRGSVQLLASDDSSGAMLLEACQPGSRLADVCGLV